VEKRHIELLMRRQCKVKLWKAPRQHIEDFSKLTKQAESFLLLNFLLRARFTELYRFSSLVKLLT
jgi:hypothetical protein